MGTSIASLLGDLLTEFWMKTLEKGFLDRSFHGDLLGMSLHGVVIQGCQQLAERNVKKRKVKKRFNSFTPRNTNYSLTK